MLKKSPLGNAKRRAGNLVSVRPKPVSSFGLFLLYSPAILAPSRKATQPHVSSLQHKSQKCAPSPLRVSFRCNWNTSILVAIFCHISQIFSHFSSTMSPLFSTAPPCSGGLSLRGTKECCVSFHRRQSVWAPTPKNRARAQRNSARLTLSFLGPKRTLGGRA